MVGRVEVVRQRNARLIRRGHAWRTARAACFRQWGTDCWICGHPDAGEVDHVIPLHRGGAPYDVANLRPAHGANAPCPYCGRRCNQERNRRRPRTTTRPVAPRHVPLSIDAATL